MISSTTTEILYAFYTMNLYNPYPILIPQFA
jgi:hypothetical protein